MFVFCVPVKNVFLEDGGALSFPWIAADALDAVWTESSILISSNPIYDLIDKNFATDDSNINLNDSLANVIKFLRRISEWLKKFNYETKSLHCDLKTTFEYFFKLDFVGFSLFLSYNN